MISIDKKRIKTDSERDDDRETAKWAIIGFLICTLICLFSILIVMIFHYLNIERVSPDSFRHGTLNMNPAILLDDHTTLDDDDSITFEYKIFDDVYLVTKCYASNDCNVAVGNYGAKDYLYRVYNGSENNTLYMELKMTHEDKSEYQSYKIEDFSITLGKDDNLLVPVGIDFANNKLTFSQASDIYLHDFKLSFVLFE